MRYIDLPLPEDNFTLYDVEYASYLRRNEICSDDDEFKDEF